MAHTRGEINVGDLNSTKKYDREKAYSQSKLANILFSRELAKRLEGWFNFTHSGFTSIITNTCFLGTGVTVNSLHPGIVDTELFRHLIFFNSPLAKLIFKPLFWPFTKTPRNGAQTTLFVALDEDLSTTTGRYFADCDLRQESPAAQDDAMAKWLWAVSEKWTRINFWPKRLNESAAEVAVKDNKAGM